MAASLGSLVVSLGLNAAEFVSGMNKAQYEAQRAMGRLKGTFGDVGRAFAGIISVGAATAFTKSIINANDHLQDLSERSGITVEELNGLRYAFTLAGAEASDVEKSMRTLAKAISEAGTGNREIQDLFTALGMQDAAKGVSSVTDAFIALSKAFPRLSDTDKIRVSLDLLGKAGESMIPALNRGPEALRAMVSEGQKLNPVTKELTQSSNDFNDNLYKLSVTMKGLLGPAVLEITRLFNNFAEGIIAGRKAGLDFGDSLSFGNKLLNAKSHIAEVSDEVSKLEAEQAKFNERSNTGLIGWINNLGVGKINFGDPAGPLAEARKQLALLQQEAAKTDTAPKAAPTGGKRIILPNKDAAAVAKKFLDKQLSDLENSIKDEQDIYSARERFLQAYYQDDLIGQRQYFEGRKNALDESTRNIVAAYDEEIAALRKFASGAKGTDRVEAETKIADAIAKRAKVQRDAANEATMLYLDEGRAASQYSDSIKELSARMLELAGNTAEAAAIRFDLQNRGLRNQALDKGDTETLRQLDALKAEEGARLRLDKVSRQYANTVQLIGIEQASIDLQQQAGAITTLEAINKKSEVAKQYISILEQEANAYEAIANSLGAGVDKEAAITQAKRLRLEISQLGESAKELENTFRKTFEDAFADGLSSIIDGTKSASAAFKDMERQIVASITRIATQNIAESIFGKGGIGGGGGFDIAGLLAKAFGGGLGGFAEGGAIGANRAVMVGERGPELFVPNAAGNVVPNSVLMDKRASKQSNINISINVPSGTSRTTADQIAVRTGLAVRRALNRNA